MSRALYYVFGVWIVLIVLSFVLTRDLSETEDAARRGYQALFDAWGLELNAADPARLVLFPEMDDRQDVHEITTACWDILGKSPDQVMCASSRMPYRSSCDCSCALRHMDGTPSGSKKP